MDRTYKYASLQCIVFKVTMSGVFDLLKKAGEIPAGFELDTENTDEIDVCDLAIRRIDAIPEPKP